MNSKYITFFASSVDDQKLAATVEGAISTVGSFLLFMGFFDVATETVLLAHINQLITDAVVVTPLIFSMVSLCYTIFGLIRKAVVTLARKTTSQASATVASVAQPIVPN